MRRSPWRRRAAVKWQFSYYYVIFAGICICVTCMCVHCRHSCDKSRRVSGDKNLRERHGFAALLRGGYVVCWRSIICALRLFVFPKWLIARAFPYYLSLFLSFRQVRGPASNYRRLRKLPGHSRPQSQPTRYKQTRGVFWNAAIPTYATVRN